MNIEEAKELLQNTDKHVGCDEELGIVFDIKLRKAIETILEDHSRLQNIVRAYNTFKNETMASDIDIIVLLKTDYERMTKAIVEE